MRLCLVSDLHGETPDLPDADLVIIAGDLAPDGDLYSQYRWFHSRFKPWIRECKRAVYIAGNHDRLLFEQPDLANIHEDHCHYLQDSFIEIDGLLIYGTPWSLKFGRWPFMCHEADIDRRLSHVVRRPDILITHGPPYGLGDQNDLNEHCGSGTLLEFMRRVRPRLTVTGHIHESYGVYPFGDCTVVNASLCTGEMIPSNALITYDL
jgi:Icc-related predicted phosphoesterase